MALPLGPVVTAAGAFITFVASFVQIVKADSDVVDLGWSVWTTEPGFFGVGTWIPVFALLAAAAALARAFARGLDQKQVLGFGLLQVQVAAVAFAVLLWLGYVVNAVLSDDTALGLGALLLVVGLAAVAAGTVLSILHAQKATTTAIGASGGPPAGAWGAPTGPQPHSVPPAGGPWPQPTQPAAPPIDPGRPPGGALVDPGTEVIPGPPPPPPPDDHVGGGPDALPPSGPR